MRVKPWLLSTSIIFFIIIDLIFGFYIYNYLHSLSSKPSVKQISGYTMKLYTDPKRCFTISIPQSWQVDTKGGIYTPDTFEHLTFAEDPNNVIHRDADLAIYIEVHQKGGKFTDNEHPNSQLGDLPAYFDGHTMSLVDSGFAHFQIYAAYPGADEVNYSSLAFHSSPMQSTNTKPEPVPADDIAKWKSLSEAIISSFKPESYSLSCR